MAKPVDPRTHEPHDALFRAAFQIPRYTEALLRAVLVREVHDEIDWSTLARDSSDYVDNQLHQQRADLVFVGRLRGGVPVSFPLEHQSTRTEQMPARFARYSFQFWERQLAEHPAAPVPLPLPVLVSNATTAWDAARSLEALFAPRIASIAALAPHVPRLPLTVVDLAVTSNAELEAMAMPAFPTLVLWALRDGRSKSRVLANLPHWARTLADTLATPGASRELRQLVMYFTTVTPELTYDELRAKIEETVPELQEVTMTIAQELQAKGRIEGRNEGRIEGRIEGHVEVLRRQLALKFGHVVSPEIEARIATATIERLDRYLERVLTAAAIDDVFVE